MRRRAIEGTRTHDAAAHVTAPASASFGPQPSRAARARWANATYASTVTTTATADTARAQTLRAPRKPHAIHATAPHAGTRYQMTLSCRIHQGCRHDLLTAVSGRHVTRSENSSREELRR